MGENVVTLEENSFSGCTAIDVINLPGVTEIKKNALTGCTQLDTVYFGVDNIITITATSASEIFSSTSEIIYGKFKVYVKTQELADHYNSTAPWSNIKSWQATGHDSENIFNVAI
jgi:hypothetical protein